MSVSHLPEKKVQALYEKYGPTIYSRCRRLLRDPVAAEDATQEVFLRVLRRIDAAPEERAILAWIYRISTNYCLNQLRDGQRRAQPMEVLPEQLDGDLEAQVMSRDFADRLMSQTPHEIKAPVVMYHLKGMEQADIARALGVSRRTVLYRLAAFNARAHELAKEQESFA